MALRSRALRALRVSLSACGSAAPSAALPLASARRLVLPRTGGALSRAYAASARARCSRGWAGARLAGTTSTPARSPRGPHPACEQGNISKWLKKEGEKVVAGDVLAEIETDKATMEMESMEEGYLAKILKPDGAQNVRVGETVAVMVEAADDVAAFASYTGAPAAAPAAAAAPPPTASAAAASAPPAAAPHAAPRAAAAVERVFASPLARRVAAEAGLSLSGVVGTGPEGRIVRADVAEALARAPPAAASAAVAGGPSALDAFFPHYTDASVSTIRRTIARRLQESKQTVPHFYLSLDVRMDALLAARRALNVGERKLSVNDLVLKAAALACKAVPDVNAAWLGDKIRRYEAVDISVAVQTEAGLMVPILRSAESKGLDAISAEVRALAVKARAGKLAPVDYTGGTFTVSNMGMLGVKSFAAIVNPPQAAILAVGATRPEVVALPAGGFASVSVMNVTLSCDHRVVDGAVGAAWLAAFKSRVEDPLTMLC